MCNAVYVHGWLYAQVATHAMYEFTVACAPTDGVLLFGYHNPLDSFMRRIPQDEATSSSSLHPAESSHAGIR